MFFILISILGHSVLKEETEYRETGLTQKAEKSLENCLSVNAITHIGFYNFTIQQECQITALLNSRSVRMFLLFEPFHAEEFTLEIDGKSVKTGSIYTNGRIIEGDSKVVVRFLNGRSREKKVNIWLLPTDFCSGLSIYAYNSYSIDLKIPYTNPQICLFSPSFDSMNGKFRLNFGINSKESNHISSLYTKSFYCPEKIVTGSKILKSKVKGSSIVEFKYNSSIPTENKNTNFYNNFIFYKRITNQIDNTGNSHSKSSIGSIEKCNSSHGCFSHFFPPLEVNVEDRNWASDIEIGPCLIALLGLIIFVFLICCLCKRIKKKNMMLSIKEDIHSLIPRNNNESLINAYFPTQLSDNSEGI